MSVIVSKGLMADSLGADALGARLGYEGLHQLVSDGATLLCTPIQSQRVETCLLLRGAAWLNPGVDGALASMCGAGATSECAALFQEDLPEGRERMRP